MQIVRHISALRTFLNKEQLQRRRIALVPTMGNLHNGHIRLIERAQECADTIVVSIFVNPLQFDRAADFNAYPRTLEEDTASLQQRGVHVVFVPNEQELYGNTVESQTKVVVPELSDMLCGAHRSGHFVGVTTVVAKLFNIVQPQIAIFGEKDYQQLVIIKRMVSDLDMPIQIEQVATTREPDGLAMSSRNRYLTTDERRIAPHLYLSLQEIARQLADGNRDFSALSGRARQALITKGFKPDYVEIRRSDTLAPAQQNDTRFVVLAAAWLGQARLIDNVLLDFG